MEKKLACSFLVFMLIFSVTMVSVDGAPPLTKLFVDPPTYTATQIGEVFTININVSNVQNLATFAFKLGYNTALLDALEVVEGPFPSPPVSSITGINETEGYVWMMAWCNPTDGNGTLATITFNVTYAGSASCTLDLYDTTLADGLANPISHEVEDGYYEFAILSITATTDKPAYTPGENVQIHGNLTLDGSPHEGLVALEVDDPGNYGIVRRTLQVGPTPPPGEITIIDVVPCDMWGQPKESFSRGTLAYFNVTVRNSGTEWKKAAVTVNAYDGNMVPLGAPTLIATIGPGTYPGFSIECFAIPDWAYTGTGMVYASVFTDLPRYGGVPICPGKSANFTITGSSGGAASLETQNPGNYTLTFKLAPNARSGIYRVYASANYQKQFVMGKTVFGVNVICVPNDYPTIQEAINAANSTHYTILVLPKIYNENIFMNKTLTLVAKDPSNTIINGSGIGTVVTITANNVEISRFTIKNGGSSPDSGIALIDSSYSTISENIITSNKGYGIYLNHSTATTLKDNTMSYNKYNFAVFGDYISDFTHDIDTTNTVDGKPIIYWLNKQNSTVPFNAGFVAIVYSTKIVLRELDLTKNSQGVLFAFTNDSLIERVDIESNEHGIYMIHSHGNTIVGSTVSNNSVGIYQSYSNENIICHNNFTDNTIQVDLHQSLNTWDDGAGWGNYWDDYVGVDGNGDGVGDTNLPHQGVDWYPLMSPWVLVHDVAVTNVTLEPPDSLSQLYPGMVIKATVTVENEGDFTESFFDVIAYYDGNTIETRTVPELIPQKETAISLSWDTTGVPPGNYTISTSASAVPGETLEDQLDNSYTDGTVTLLVPTEHDVAVTSVTPYPIRVFPGQLVTITVVAENEGHFTETFTVTTYYDNNPIDTKTVTLRPLANTTLTSTWNTTDVPYGNYTIKAKATLLEDTNPTNDEMVDGTVDVRLMGDVEGDGDVDPMDLLTLKLALSPGTPYYGTTPGADVDLDGDVDPMDLLTLKIILSMV